MTLRSEAFRLRTPRVVARAMPPDGRLFERKYFMSDVLTLSRARDGQRGLVRPPFNARPVSSGGRADRSASGPFATHYSATASYLYINRLSGFDRFGKVPDDYIGRGDLIAAGRCHPQQKMPAELKEGDRIWREADAAAADEAPAAVSATHIVADLPEGSPESWRRLVERFCYRHLVERGMVLDWAIHAKADDQGGWSTRPHVHLLCTARFWRPNARRGDRQRQWLANAAQIREVEEAWLELLGLVPAAASQLAA